MKIYVIISKCFSFSYLKGPLKKCLCLMPRKYHKLPKGVNCFKNETDTNTDKFGRRTALHIAARFDEYDCTRILINAGASMEAQDINQETPIQLAAGYGKCASVNVLVTMNATIPASHKTKIEACVPGTCKLMKFLMILSIF